MLGTAEAAAADLAVGVIGRLFRLVPRLVDLQDLGARGGGLSFARGRVLRAPHEGGLVPMRALSQLLGISPRMVTGPVDALEADGWVTRSPHPADRHATIISLTPAAKRSMSTAWESARNPGAVQYERAATRPRSRTQARGQHRSLGKPRRAITCY